MTLDTAEIVRRADANMLATYTTMIAALEGGEVRERDGMLIICAGVPIAQFNWAFVTRPLVDPQRQIGDAIAYFDDRALPFIVRLREGVDAAAERTAEALGLPYSDTVPGMVLTDMGAQSPSPEGLDIRGAATRAEFDEHVETLALGFDMPLSSARAFLSPRTLAIPDLRFYTGYADNVPVATSALFVSHRTAGIYNVSTHPDHRGRGIGEAMTRRCVRDGAAAGCLIASLQASEMGKPVYERIGFRTVAPYRTFHRPG